MHARGVPRVHRRRVRRFGLRHPLRSAGPRVGRRTGPGLLRRTTATPAGPARLLVRHLLGRGGLHIPARPDHLRAASGRAAGTPVRDSARDRLVLPGVGPSAARVPLILRSVERPLPGVVRVWRRADRRLLSPTRLAAPPPTTRRLGATASRRRTSVARARHRPRPVPRVDRRRPRAGPLTPTPTGAGRRRQAHPGRGPTPAVGWRCGSARPRRTDQPEQTPRAHATRRLAGARAGCHRRVPSPGNSRPECDPSEPKAESAVQV